MVAHMCPIEGASHEMSGRSLDHDVLMQSHQAPLGIAKGGDWIYAHPTIEMTNLLSVGVVRFDTSLLEKQS